ncbi:WhiB family transcriptional regulator [Glycomyces sp. NPDC048151]|uniref:WhiB family transcriptional regulator n=1 Tax=Glycomyces sp. NPDC048151 TaxID=3364002 RepID=UPI00371F3226
MADRWDERAACQGMNTEIWFGSAETTMPLAKLICRRCPVQYECLRAALQVPGTKGVWGGLSETQRSRLTAKTTPTGRVTRTVAPGGMAAVNAAKTHCKYEHEFTEENTIVYAGKRSCRQCYQDRLLAKRKTNRKRVSA